MDRRQQKTRKSIFNAFGQLLARKNYSRITVQEIIDEANIGRSTFYAHFETKDELLRELCTELFRHVFSEEIMHETTHNFTFSRDDNRAIITHILYHLRDNRENVLSIMSSESGDIFLQYFREYLNSTIINRMVENVDMNALGIPKELLINHISGTFISIIQWWIKEGVRKTPEELAEYFFKLIVPVLL